MDLLITLAGTWRAWMHIVVKSALPQADRDEALAQRRLRIWRTGKPLEDALQVA
jgi:hypothetical protein